MQLVQSQLLNRSCLVFVAAAGLVAAGWIGGCKSDPPVSPPTSSPSTPTSNPASAPSATKPVAKDEPKPLSYFDVIRTVYPEVPATQPLAAPVSLREASRFVLSDPVLLDEQGHLWITRPGVPKTEAALRAAPDVAGSEHVIPERIEFAWWLPDKGGEWTPMAIVQTEGKPGAFQMVTPTRRQPMGSRSDYVWSRARSWADGNAQRLVVPTRNGISIFTYQGHREPPVELYQAIGDGSANISTTRPATTPVPERTREEPDASRAKSNLGTIPNEVCFAFEPQGLIAWMPFTKGAKTPASSATAARFTSGAWQPLAGPDWPAELLHVIPMRDGSVTQLIASPPGLRLGFTAVSTIPISRKAVDDLLERLNDLDSAVRKDAFQQLANFGPGLIPVLKSIPEDNFSPEAKIAVRGLLKRQTTPMLGGLSTKAEHLRLVRRLRDGGVLLYTEDGVTFPDPQGDEPLRQAPAWIAARPGRPVELLTADLMADVKPEDPQVDVAGSRWTVTTDGRGPRLFAANLFKNLLRKSDAEYSAVVGIDRSGRWLFRKPGSLTGPTLIVDPTVADFSRLPVWVFDNSVPEGQEGEAIVGWDKEGWPAVKQGTIERRLMEGDWAPLGENNPILTELPASEAKPAEEVAPAAPAISASPATQPSATQPATKPALPAGPLLLTDAAGHKYFGGEEQLVVVRADGSRVDWPLAGTSAGQSPVTLILANGRLYLFNAPGRVLRIKPTPDGPQPFVVEQSFARDIPNGEAPRRIWLDPAGRIIMAMERKLVILFPGGYIPPAIREKMRDEDDEND